ncbi:helix-turn-helix transcriptional regulator [Sphingobium sp. Sx8-8]|uniref:helix-turn-helix transcriptional regulator n=1 Tax=Sphingobium sp. Sx8-8 TaxID=2933617 RepID=UPI001F55E1FC|nr:helix-turn-helix transcriptional regulator [Sphingobium sp. Sx8-8]
MAMMQAQQHAGFQKQVFVKRAVSGASIEIADFEFDGTELVGCEDRSLLRWRLAPDYFSSYWQLPRRREYVKLGNLMFLTGRVPYRTRPSNPLRFSRNLLCHFEPELESRILDDCRQGGRPAFSEFQDIRCGRIELTLRRMLQEMMQPGFASELLLDGLLAALVVDICRYFRRDMPEALETSRRCGMLSKTDLQKIVDFIHDARGGCPTVSQLANVCGINLSTFRSRFKSTTGRSVHSYVEEVQLERAKDLLLNSGMLMKEIAYDLGFTHQATFTSSFRRLVGMSPSDYRDAHRH